MPIFHSDDDRRLFLLEINKPVDSSPSEDDHKRFLKRRSVLGTLFKSFNKSQTTKRQWGRHRFEFMKTIRKWHHGPEGRRFHRKLDRFLATHITFPKGGLFLARESWTKQEIEEFRRLLLVESNQYYHSTCEQFAMECMIDELTEVIKTFPDAP